MSDIDDLVNVLRRSDPRRPLKNRMGLSYLERSPTHFLVYCAVIRSLKSLMPVLRKPNSIVAIVVPTNWQMMMVETVAEKVLGVEDLPEKIHSRIRVYSHPDGRDLKKDQGDEAIFEKLLHKQLVVLLPSGTSLMPELELVVECIVELQASATKDLVALARLRRNGVVSENDAALLRQQPPSYMTAIFRPGYPLKVAIDKIRDQKGRFSPYDREVLTLADVPNFRGATKWGRSLQTDIEQWRAGSLNWSEIDKGVLLVGPPGTGKTMFARVLANTCGLAFYPHSLAQWQSLGHMGDLLKGMNRAFAIAKAAAPAMLFLDELDSIGDRETFSGQNEHYQTEVLNALLEKIDGSIGREGVIVAGATNYREKIDKALLRSGRLERHIEFELPDTEAREEILRFYLPQLPASPELKDLASRLNRWTPADLERLSRSARRVAREKNRAVRIADLVSTFPEKLPLSERDLRRIAIHEAGHAVVAISLGMELKRVSISRDVDPVNRSPWLGVTTTIRRAKDVRGKKDILDDINLMLAGTAAEAVIFEERTTFAAGENEGDLFDATQLAFELVARFGLGTRLALIPGQSVKDMAHDAHLRAEVDGLLRKQFDFVSNLLTRLRNHVLKLSEALVRNGELSGEQASDIFIGSDRLSRGGASEQ